MTDTLRNPPSMYVQPEAKGILRSRFLPGQELSWQDLTTDQDYHILLRRSVNRYGLGFTGIMHGLSVELDAQTAVVSPGMAIDGWGREILLVDQASLSLSGTDALQGDRVFYVNVAYYEITRVFSSPGQGRAYGRTVESPHLYWSAEKPLSALDGVLLATLQRSGGKLEVIRSTDNGRTLIGRRVLFSDAQTQDSAVGCAISLASDGRSLLVDGAMSITPLPSVGGASESGEDPGSALVFSVKGRAQGSAEPTDALTVDASGDLTLAGAIRWREPENVTLKLGPRTTQSGDPTGLVSPQLHLSAPAIYLDAPVWVNVDGTPTPFADAGYWKLDSTTHVLSYQGDVDVRGAASGSVQLRPAGTSAFSNALAVTGSAAFGASSVQTGWSLYAESGAWLRGTAGPDKLALWVQGAAHLGADAKIDGALSVTSSTASHFSGPLTVSGALSLDGATETSQVMGSLTVHGLLSAGNVKLDDASALSVSAIESSDKPLSLLGVGGVEVRAKDASGTLAAATLRLLPQDESPPVLLEGAAASGESFLRIDQTGRSWSLPRPSGQFADLGPLVRLIGPGADTFSLDPGQLAATFPTHMDRGLVDLLGLIAPLVQAIAILSQRLDQQSGTASGLLDKIAEIAKVVSGLPLR